MRRFDQCVQQRPDDEQALFGKAVALQLLGELDQARSLYEEILGVNPDSGNALKNLLTLGIKTGDDSPIQKYAERLLATDPEALPALSGLASRAFRAGEFEEAADYCRRIIAVSP